jgi:phosphoribosylformylglycinamidine cyclo-ligase
MANTPVTYKDSGVDIEAGDALVRSIKGIVKETHNASVLSNIGGFGGLFRPEFSAYEEPVLVSSVDGVGTKLNVSFMMEKYDTVGQDLVNHCVNDIAVCGAEPLFFLDYFATGKLKPDVGYEVIKGFTVACKENGCALIGGETAEMPGLYKDGEFDLAGTIVGVVDRKKIITGERVKKGDVLIGFESTGLHTNGFSLARKVLFSEFKVTDVLPELGMSLGEALLKVHKSYLADIRALKAFEGVHAYSHITGGGIEGNTKRVVPEGLSLQVDYDAWVRPPLFRLIQEVGNVPEEDIRQALNLGIGLVAVVDAASVQMVIEWGAKRGTDLHIIGEVV